MLFLSIYNMYMELQKHENYLSGKQDKGVLK